MLVQGSFGESDVRVGLRDEPRPTTSELDLRIERRWKEAHDLAQRERRPLFDGPVLRWLRLSQETAPDGRMRLRLEVGRGRFREFVGTNLDPEVRPDLAGGDIPWSHFGNAVGTSALVVTGDGRLVAGRRSRRVLGYAGHVHSFGGLLEAVDAADGEVDAFASMRRELHEELALAPAETGDLTLLGAIVDPRIHQPELLFRARVAQDARELRERWRGASSRDEHSELLEFPDDPRAIEAALAAAAPVSAIGRDCFALHFAAAGR